MADDLKVHGDIEMINPASLAPYDRNSRTHSSGQVAQIVASIREFGFTNPVLIDDAEGIVAGHGRVLAALELDLERVPCIRLSGLSDEQRRAYVIADNKLAENAGWDRELLRLELGDLRDLEFDLSVIGFGADELDELFLDTDGLEEDGLTEDDETPEPDDRFVSQRGDVWICGKHRVMCGDATAWADVERLVGTRKVDMAWTDPPYNVDYEGSAGKIENDNMGADEFAAFLRDAFANIARALKKGAAIYVAHADTEGLAFRLAYESAGLKLSGCLIWIKPSLVLGRSDYQWRHEPILYGWKPGAAHRWFGGRKQTTVIEAEDLPFVVRQDGSLLIDTGGGHIHVTGKDLKIEEFEGSILRHEKPTRSAEHPTMKPVGLIIEYLKNSSRRGDVVLDPFGGSGSTLIAAHKIGRATRVMELDPKFADVIVRRWQNYTGDQALLEESGATFASVSGQRAVG